MPIPPHEVVIDLARDALLSEQAHETLTDRYMIAGETSPQHAFARAAAAFADDKEHGQRLYDYVSKGWFMFATPLLSNGGTERGLPISCYLNAVADSREGLLSHYEENAWLASMGGGIGGAWSDIRSVGTATSRGSRTSGVIPFIKVVDAQMLAFSQGSTRRGSYAGYLDISHPEIEEWLEMRKASGGDQNRKTLNLHHGVNITNDFMRAVRAGEDFPLVDPHSGEVRKHVSARALFRKIIDTRHQTGEPYLFFIDTANAALPEPLRKRGHRVRHSNLCVAGHTPILTLEHGYVPISEVDGQFVNVWNGEEWSETEVVQTSKGSDLLSIGFSNGADLNCTPYHKFFIQENYHSAPKEVRASELRVGDKLIKCSFPVITHEDAEEWDDAYASGFFCGDGTHGPRGDQILWLYGEKRKLVGEFLPFAKSVSIRDEDPRDAVYFGVEKLHEKFTVPHGTTLATRLEWLAGYFDADGTVARNGSNESIQVVCADHDFLDSVRLLLNTMGLNPKIRPMRDEGVYALPDGKGGLASFHCRELKRLLISSGDLYRLMQLGYKPRRLRISGRKPQRDANHFITVESISDGGHAPTYCFTEPKRHMGVFNGILAGNCTEITLPTSEQRTAVCCLSSVNLAKWHEWKRDPRFLEDLMRMLDNTLDVFIEKAPEQLRRAIHSALSERSVGLGAFGWHTFLQQEMVPWESDLARGLNLMIFSHIEKQVSAASHKLANERGAAPDMKPLKERFAHKTAIAPNASSSTFIADGPVSPSIEPVNTNAFLHKTLTGSHPVKNRVLEKLLKELGKDTKEVWQSIIANSGSVQHLDFLTEKQKAVFKTSREIKQRWVVRHAADRQKFIDQAQSVNLFYDAEVPAREIVDDHFAAWEMGLKSLYYLRATSAKRAENTNSVVDRRVVEAPIEAEVCVACEG